jgi:hypothetical protein
MNPVEVDHNLCVFLEPNLLAIATRNAAFVYHGLGRSGCDWWLNPQRLVEAHWQVFELHNLIKAQVVDVAQSIKWGSNFIHQLLPHTVMLGEVVNQIRS